MSTARVSKTGWDWHGDRNWCGSRCAPESSPSPSRLLPAFLFHLREHRFQRVELDPRGLRGKVQGRLGYRSGHLDPHVRVHRLVGEPDFYGHGHDEVDGHVLLAYTQLQGVVPALSGFGAPREDILGDGVVPHPLVEEQAHVGTQVLLNDSLKVPR